MAFIIGLIGLFCLGKAIFMGWLHKSEWKLLRITAPGRWWKLQIKQATWAVVGIMLIFIYGSLTSDKDKKSSGSKQSVPTEQTEVNNKGKKSKQKYVEQKNSTSSSSPMVETENETEGTPEVSNHESEETEESDGNTSSSTEIEAADETNSD